MTGAACVLLAGLMALAACEASDTGPSTDTHRSSPSLTPTPEPAVLVAAGDIASCEQETDSAVAALIEAQEEATVAALGDLVYPEGSDAYYAKCYDDAWGAFRDRTRPAIGNHDAVTDGGAAYFDYFDAAAGEPGEGWYAYELGAWYVVVLNSNCEVVRCEPGSPQHDWLLGDLAASDAPCTLAYFHHPPTGSGIHGRYPPVDPLWAVLVDADVDLALAGHEHHYERFAPLGADARPDPEGLRLIIAGTGGIALRAAGEPVPGSEVVIDDTHGILRLELAPDGYAFEFVAVDGSVRDRGAGTCDA